MSIKTEGKYIQVKNPMGGGFSKRRNLKPNYQKSASLFLIFSMLGQIVAGAFLFAPTQEAKASNPDWLTGWNYRTPVLIDNSSQTLTDYQTKITLQGTDPTAPNYIDFDKVLPNGADLRITDSDKVTQIPYWIESWDNTAKTATVWTKVPTIPASATPPYFKFSTSNANHNDYGLSYPVTYEFNIPASSSSLHAYKKYTENGTWTQLTEKISTDFFNGIEAVRFDYTNNKAYLSVAFDANSNDIYLKVTNASDVQVGTYQKIDKYYDNRDAAVVVTADDWTTQSELDNQFGSFADLFAQDKIWFSPGIITNYLGKAPNWALIQSKINNGYLEPISHSHNHLEVLPYPDYDSEIRDSRDNLINNLDLPAANKKGNQEYIYGWIEPAGLSDSTVRAKLGQYKYLADRSTDINQSNYASWDSVNGLYNRIGVSISLDDPSVCVGARPLPETDTLNSDFDSVVVAGGVYHLFFHPRCVTTARVSPHFDYIKQRTNIWYAGFGHLYLYDFTRERATQNTTISGENLYIYYGKSGVASLSNYDNVFTKDYGESGLVGLWHMDEGTPGSELLTDGGLETWTNTTALTNWTNDSASTGVRDITQEATTKQAGPYSLKLAATSNSGGTPFGVWQNITTVSGGQYQVNLYQDYATRTAGTLKIEAWDNTGAVSLSSQSITTAGTALTYTSFRFTSTNTTSVKIKIYLNSETAGVAYIDSLSVKQSSNSLTDSSGNSNAGTIYGASRTATDGGRWGSRNDTVFSTGSALQFDGKDDYVDAGNNAGLNPESGNFTISFWSKVNDISDTGIQGILNKKYLTNFLIAKAQTKTLMVYLKSSAAAVAISNYFSLGDWVFTTIVLTNNNTVAVYKNGSYVTSGSYVGPLSSTQNFVIGNYELGRYFNGAVDEVRMYNRALSPEEIMTQYQRRKYIVGGPSSRLSSVHSLTSLFKSTTNTISSTDHISYSSNPAVSNLVNSNISFTPPTGSIDVTLTDTAASANYANSTLPGLTATNLDRETDFNHNGTTSLKITPFSNSVDIAVDTWHTSVDYYKKWTEASTTSSVNTSHTIGDLEPNTYYTLKIDTANQNTYLSNSTGQITFTYSGGYSTHTFEITEDTNAPASFTLVSPANNTVTSNRTPAFSWNASSDTESNLSKYQLYIDGIMDKDNISNSSASTSPSTELSCTDHSWYIKAIDNNGNSTNSNTFNLNINCAAGFISPIKPNTSTTTLTLSPEGKLNLNNLPADIIQIAISTTPDFRDVSWEDISKKDELLQKYADASKLYLKFKTKDGAVSDIVTYEKGSSNNPTVPSSSYPTGTLLKLPNSPRVYVIIDGKKKWISTPEVFEQLGYKWTDIKIITEAELNALTDYEDNLIRQAGDYKVYLVVNGIKRHIPNPEVFLDYGFFWNDIKEVDKTTMDKYKETFLIKESGKNEVYYIIDGIKKWIPTMDIFNSYNDKPEDIQIISKKEMESYPLSNLIRLNDSNDVYLIEGNIKKHIPNPQVFNKYKLNWNYVMSVNQTEFNFYKDGGELK